MSMLASRSIPLLHGRSMIFCPGRCNGLRTLSAISQSARRTQSTGRPANSTAAESLVVPPNSKIVYEGPYSKTFKYLKLFSLSSLGLSAALSPFIFILESTLPTSGRIFLAVTAISTTTFSTYLISLFTGPYVNRIIRADDARHPFILSTTSMFLQERNTFINDQAILAPSERPLTTWKLREEADNQATATALEAVTTDRAGKVLGRWTVGETGKAQQNGQIVRYFNVHPELLEARFTSTS